MALGSSFGKSSIQFRLNYFLADRGDQRFKSIFMSVSEIKFSHKKAFSTRQKFEKLSSIQQKIQIIYKTMTKHT